MLIKHKLMTNALIAVCSLGIMYLLFIFTLETVKELNKGKVLALQMETDMLQLRREEKDFLARSELEYVERFDQKTVQMLQNQDQLIALLRTQGESTEQLEQLKVVTQRYQQSFHNVTDVTVLMGLDHTSGLRGELRAAVHQLEQALKSVRADEIMITMLQLRRAEKDFMLRSNVKYLKKFDGLHSSMLRQLEYLVSSGAADRELIELAELYGTRFREYADQAKALGLDSQQGLLLEMRKTVRSTEEMLEALFTSVNTILEARIQQSQWLSSLLFVGMLILCSALSWRIGRSVFRSIDNIQGAVRRIHETHDLSLRMKDKGNDEIAGIARSLNMMLAGFQDVISRVNMAVDTMNSSTKALSDNAAKTVDDIERQKEETSMVNHAITEMVGTIEEIARNTEKTAHKAINTHAYALEGQKQVQLAIEKIHTLSDQLESSVSTVEQLSRESEIIGSVLNVIQEIAEQTNLLALNAAIEAARAGEQGRGFAVVADEVRTLAGRTQEATVEISGIISSLQQKTMGIVELMDECREKGGDSRQQASGAEAVLKAITEDVTEISDMASQVASAIEQQSSAANEISRNISTIRQITDQTATTVHQNREASQKIDDQAQSLRDAVSVFST
ncbi:methyl-accepting chemotaxis protein [Oceanospirillum sediminis]|uniref:Methyl-accepting chemotaxis protein n=1 Tax=Oceanospirillum sediminis TaxID=2760088 RepID=A0A839INZ5_9GAMM|nr:methyl-accepting chemotaxis protein [Oceanospirillum sediminis]MBB1486187.1 methyl-accepting chemotaxis protein [Oceanospirillum sediminis]